MSLVILIFICSVIFISLIANSKQKDDNDKYEKYLSNLETMKKNKAKRNK